VWRLSGLLLLPLLLLYRSIELLRKSKRGMYPAIRVRGRACIDFDEICNAKCNSRISIFSRSCNMPLSIALVLEYCEQLHVSLPIHATIIYPPLPETPRAVSPLNLAQIALYMRAPSLSKFLPNLPPSKPPKPPQPPPRLPKQAPPPPPLLQCPLIRRRRRRLHGIKTDPTRREMCGSVGVVPVGEIAAGDEGGDPGWIVFEVGGSGGRGFASGVEKWDVVGALAFLLVGWSCVAVAYFWSGRDGGRVRISTRLRSLFPRNIFCTDFPPLNTWPVSSPTFDLPPRPPTGKLEPFPHDKSLERTRSAAPRFRDRDFGEEAP